MAAGILLVFIATIARGVEPRDMLGLRLTLEPVARSLIVDGVEVRIQHVQGEDVAVLAQRMASRWRAEGDMPRHLQQRGWQMLARYSAGNSELIQWRGEGPAAVLLHSSLDTRRPLQRAVAAPFRLPSQCAWGRVIQNRESTGLPVQRTAACRGDAGEVRSLLRVLLPAAGWQLRESGDGALELQRGAVAGRLLLGDLGHGAGCVLVWLGVHAVVQAAP